MMVRAQQSWLVVSLRGNHTVRTMGRSNNFPFLVCRHNNHTVAGFNDDLEALVAAGLRFFSPDEVLALHEYPPGFAFPPSIPKRNRRYHLVGNSVNVLVVAWLLKRLFHLCDGGSDDGGGDDGGDC